MYVMKLRQFEHHFFRPPPLSHPPPLPHPPALTSGGYYEIWLHSVQVLQSSRLNVLTDYSG